jgi:hypothetical protein
MGKIPLLKQTMLASCLKVAKKYGNRWQLLDAALAAAKVNGWVAEFGVLKGKSLREIAKRIRPAIIHGFDSFDGLQEVWAGKPVGALKLRESVKARIEFPPNAEMHVGTVQETVPPFVAKQTQPARLLHIDTDTYLPAKSILADCNEKIVPGTVIIFDEYWNYKGWEEHEARAFCEWLMRENRNAVPIGICKWRLAVKVTQ